MAKKLLVLRKSRRKDCDEIVSNKMPLYTQDFFKRNRSNVYRPFNIRVLFFLSRKNFSPGEEIVKTSNVVSLLMDVPASFFSFLYTSACVLHWYYIPAAIGLSPSQRNRCIIYPHVCVIASISRVSLFFSLETRAVCIPFLYLQACLYGIPTPANQKDETCVCKISFLATKLWQLQTTSLLHFKYITYCIITFFL